jgi:glycosyltransferase involved in cell wall biosynthesis
VTTPEVTVVIPTRASGRGLDRAISSALTQEGVDVQLIVVVDAHLAALTPDAGLLRRLSTPHRVVMAGAVGSPGPLRNLAVSLGQTEYVAFLDDDDEYVPDKLALQIARLRSSRATVVASNAVAQLPDGGTRPYHRLGHPQRVRLREMLQTNWFITSSVLTTLQALRRVGGFPVKSSLRFCDDYVAWMKLLTLGDGFVMTEQLVKYRVASPESLSQADGMNGETIRALAVREFALEADEMSLAIALRDRRTIRVLEAQR